MTVLVLVGLAAWGYFALRAMKRGKAHGCCGNCSNCNGCK